eukprot:CAMPEP_0185715030 /NCGR_PEP_ID=MMETSP1164-20130828/39984_1 /TAXON_ID=1104430 /ORGANISM="Chrysoreinhardia sp, Strain CCMP2950" /LENGTH=761 /DNA_ID=CAMNT_0028382615 /DNA_START=32 /DNA_END=2315 /DNA_ORIENTATION=+
MTPNDFVRVASRPNAVLVNFLLCYGFMPLLGLTLGNLFGLDAALVAGMVLVGSINGGQASNLCTFIANGNVALSVLMTTATTVGAIVMTPFLCQKLLGEVVPVNAVGIVVSTLQVVLGPIVLGMALNVGAPRLVEAVKPITPLVGVVSTCLLVASSVGQVAGPIKAAGLALQVPVFLIHFLGGILGYWIARALGFGETTCRTMAIETSMKSSAFGFLLAKLHFGAEAARVPSAVSVVWMALVGSSLAVAWRFMPVDPPKFDRDVKAKFEQRNLPSLLKRLFTGIKGGGGASPGTAAPLYLLSLRPWPASYAVVVFVFRGELEGPHRLLTDRRCGVCHHRAPQPGPHLAAAARRGVLFLLSRLWVLFAQPTHNASAPPPSGVNNTRAPASPVAAARRRRPLTGLGVFTVAPREELYSQKNDRSFPRDGSAMRYLRRISGTTPGLPWRRRDRRERCDARVVGVRDEARHTVFQESKVPRWRHVRRCGLLRIGGGVVVLAMMKKRRRRREGDATAERVARGAGAEPRARHVGPQQRLDGLATDTDSVVRVVVVIQGHQEATLRTLCVSRELVEHERRKALDRQRRVPEPEVDEEGDARSVDCCSSRRERRHDAVQLAAVEGEVPAQFWPRDVAAGDDAAAIVRGIKGPGEGAVGRAQSQRLARRWVRRGVEDDRRPARVGEVGHRRQVGREEQPRAGLEFLVFVEVPIDALGDRADRFGSVFTFFFLSEARALRLLLWLLEAALGGGGGRRRRCCEDRRAAARS